MRWAVPLAVLGATLSFASLSFAQSEFGASRASTRAMPTLPPSIVESREELDFDAGVAREVKLFEFTRRLVAERAEHEAEEFEQSVVRYLKVATFMRRLEAQRETEEAARFEAQLARSSRVQRFMQRLSDKALARTLAPEPVEWIQGRRSPSAR